MARKTLAEMEQTLTDSKARQRIVSLFDEDSFVEIDKFVSPDGETAGVITGCGTVEGVPVFAFSQDVTVKGGAMCKAAAAKISKMYEMAIKNGAPVVAIYDSKGGNIAEGAATLKAYADIAAASAKLSGVVPQISLIAGVCAGAAAMTACMADFVVMTESAEFFMTAPFVAADGNIEGAGTAANAAKSGVAAMVEKDDNGAIAKVRELISILPANNLEPGWNQPIDEDINNVEITESLKGIDLIKAVANKDGFVELYKDFGSCSVALGGLGWRTTGFVSANGKLNAADSAKIARFVSFCDAFSIPVVTILDSEGFDGGVAAELAGSVRDTAKLAQVYMSATTTKITAITGKAYGSVYCAFAPASDMVIALESSVISAAAPKAAVIFLKGDELNGANEAQLIADYENNEASPFTLAAQGNVDRVIEAYELRDAALNAVEMFSSKRVDSPKRKHINFVY